MFADLRALSRAATTRPTPGEDLLRSPQEHLHAWLRSLDAHAERLPEPLRRAARARARALRDRGLDRTPALEEACYRLFVSQQRDRDGACGHGRDPRLATRAGRGARRPCGEDFREALDAPGRRDRGSRPGARDLAREVRFRYFDEPLITAAREPAYAEMEAHVAALAEPIRLADRERRRRRARRLSPTARAAAQPTAATRAAEAAPATARGDDAPLLPRPRARGLRGDRARRPARS